VLAIEFEDGSKADLAAEYLRVESPSAELQGHHPSQRQIVGGKAQVGIEQIIPTGNYAIRLKFSDGHDTGIYSWDYLHTLSREHGRRWQRYLHELDAAGLTRA
jgi:DUF971 family protein